MQTSKLIVSAAVAVGTILGIGAASAADMAVKAGPVAVDPGYNWSGFYIGGNIGGIGASGKGQHQCFDRAGVSFGAGCEALPDQRLSGTGFLVGAQAGYNWQRDRWVFGVEGDVQGTSLKGSSTISGPFPVVGVPAGAAGPAGAPPGGNGPVDEISAASTRLNWLSTVRARVGATSGSALFYVTGGAAFGGVQTAYVDSSVIGGGGYPSSANTTRVGWTAGGGVEWGFTPKWSAKFEGLYYDLGSVTTLGTFVPPPGGGYQVGERQAINGWIARVGVNYHFGGPVVAKY
jgi:outer membrane immunogenic protein